MLCSFNTVASLLFVAYEQTSDFLTLMINRLPGQGVSTEVCNLQSPAELNALRDLRNVCRRKWEVWGGDWSQQHGHTEVDLGGGGVDSLWSEIILSCL